VGRSGARETGGRGEGRGGEGRGRRELETGGQRTSESGWQLSIGDLLLGLRLAVVDSATTACKHRGNCVQVTSICCYSSAGGMRCEVVSTCMCVDAMANGLCAWQTRTWLSHQHVTGLVRVGNLVVFIPQEVVREPVGSMSETGCMMKGWAQRRRGGEAERQRGREAERQRGREAERQRGAATRNSSRQPRMQGGYCHVTSTLPYVRSHPATGHCTRVGLAMDQGLGPAPSAPSSVTLPFFPALAVVAGGLRLLPPPGPTGPGHTRTSHT
jgi:hypothetical protein